MRRLRPILCALFLSAVACSAEKSGASLDAGDAAPDASSMVDASAPDAGTMERPDASQPDAGAEDAGAAPDAGSPVTVLSGALVGGPGPYPGPIAGVPYASGSLSGVTDAQGRYQYEQGTPVTFSIDGVVIAQVDGAAQHTPFALGSSPSCSVTSKVQRVLVLLETLDADHDPTNGISLPSFPTTAVTQTLDNLSDAAFTSFLGELANGAPIAEASKAVNDFISQVDGEEWTEVGVQTFSTTDSAVRSQGIASDGTNVWFSWRFGLQRTDMQYNTQVKNLSAIPLSISLASNAGDHIGDIDVYDHTLYAPVEDSKNYAQPRVLLYDADSLDWKNVEFDLPNNLLTQGVPWVCVDGPASLGYAAEWNPTTTLLEFDMSNFTLKRQIPLSQTLGRIQGGKVWDGMFYGNADDDAKGVYKINRETGTVITLLSRPGTGEQEGLAFFSSPDGSQLHTINATTNASAMEIHHLQRTRAPLRDQVCPGG